ncbi:MAG TPA: VWA domain-containing protein [Bacteroidia bacterium]|mgnify:CR=1 FL=1|nr:VWA domain-containing protein [Bacteroidia bacterium]
MGISLITELPFGFTVFCLLVGAGYSYLLYRKEQLMKDLPKWQSRLIAGARFTLVSLLCFLLLGPMLRVISREVEKPIVVLALDASKSIVNRKDSAEIISKYKAGIEKVASGLGSDYEVKLLSFGDHVRDNFDFNFTDKETDFSGLYKDLDAKFANRNVGAIVIASDGLYNEGSNPVYGPDRLKVPVYTIALGDTTIRKDIVISKVNANKMAFLGNNFPMEVWVDARQAAASSLLLSVAEDSMKLFTRSISVSGNNFHTSVPLFLDAKKKGIHHYVVSITQLDGEVTYTNNLRDVFVEVVENKQKILIVSAAPNPDESALKNAIEMSPNYEVTITSPSDFTGRINDYSLAILHGLPSQRIDESNLIGKFKAASIPMWFILSANTSVSDFNNIRAGIQIADNRGSLNEMQAVPAGNFSLFNVSDDLLKQVDEWPPLKGPFGVYSSNGNAYPLFSQKIGAVVTKQPLLSFADADGVKYAVLGGEGIWKWRLADFSANGSHDRSNELISKIVQYLSAKENRSPFRVIVKNSFKENEPLVFDAELYNQSEQPVNDPEAHLTIYNSKGDQFPYVFSRTENTYSLNVGQYPVGNYKYKAEVKLGDKLYAQQGEFSVNALQLETSNTVADHQLLYALSQKSGAISVMPGEEDKLINALKSREDLKPVSFTHKKLEDLVNLPWVFFLMMLLLSIEWFIRKRAGSY